jgi:predicted enzyme related to lactoylglutathione lyase
MPKLDTLELRVKNPQRQKAFYRRVFGMSEQGSNRLGYGFRELAIRFLQGNEAYMPQPSDLFWKITISVPNIELAYEQLKAKGVAVEEPSQFRDVGYLAQAYDPEGFNVEIIEHWFKGHRPRSTTDPRLLGGGPHISLLTLRAADILALQPEILRAGMRPLSVQPVEPYGFTLYFYAFTDEAPPNPHLEAIENRTWVYQRPYTVLELQHVATLNSETEPANLAAGYVGAQLSQCSRVIQIPRLKIQGGS